MQNVELKRAAVADRYTCICTSDIIVHTRSYNGPISNVNEAGAQELEKAGYLVAKPARDAEQNGPSLKELDSQVRKAERELGKMDADSEEYTAKQAELSSLRATLEQLREQLKDGK